ncbi:PaaI family thioesterase [Ornithinimicrobium panacihumi]|uniref:PaaI family thioesterase n=1 Tax=Ornithinimicrobium panacihumi TaxID=2008449 RepID=UPI003F887C2E
MSQEEQLPPPSNFSAMLGIETVAVAPDRAEYRMSVTENMANRNGVLHGGALMSLVDHAAGTLAFVCCDEDTTNVTVEAKTNFFRAARVGDVVRAVAQPLHRGRSTLVIQVMTTREDGKAVSSTTQTQLLMQWRH